MMIWDMFRRFGNTRKDPNGASKDKGRDLLKRLHNRNPQLEQFEDRVLLSVSAGIESNALWEAQLEQAIAKAANLDSYKEEWLEQTTSWVVGVEEGTDADLLAASLGADFGGQAAYLPENFTVWDFSSETDWEQVANTLLQTGAIETFYPLVPVELEAYFVPNDPLFDEQWHLQNTGQNGGTPGEDINVVPAWNYETGDGVVIGIVDGGLQWDHPDLSAQYRSDLSYDFLDDDPDPYPVGPDDNHGTAVGGSAAADGDNGIGVSGSAPGAELASIRLIGGAVTSQEMADALTYEYQSIDVYNNSWGSSLYYVQQGPEVLSAVHDGVTNGRGGLGNVYVFAAGNDRTYGGNVNQHALQNSRYTIAVAATNSNGTYASFSNPGSALLVSAPGAAVTTTDRTGTDGYNYVSDASDDQPLADMDYASVDGTSFACPVVSGVVALILDANPDLTYRDIQHILVETASKNDPYGSDWTLNGAGYWVSHDYGFGMVDAAAAVTLAKGWSNVGPELALSSGTVQVDEAIPDNSATGVVSSTQLGGQIDSIEYVEIEVDIDHPWAGDLEIVLTSPSGTKSILSETDIYEGFYSMPDGLGGWTFTTTHCWGESSEGEWTLEVRDQIGDDVGTLRSWKISAYGTEGAADSIEAIPELVAIIPNDGSNLVDGETLEIGPRELLFRFNEGQSFDVTTLARGIGIVRSGGDGVFGNANDVDVEYGWIGIGEKSNEIIIRFAETLPDDDYQITIFGEGEHPLLNARGVAFSNGTDLTVSFSLDLGAQVRGVVPQPVTRLADGSLSQARNVIEVYFNDDDLDPVSAENPDFYQLIMTADTADTNDDTIIAPENVDYDPVADKAVLTFADDLAAYGTGAYRLRVGNEYRKIDTSTPSFSNPGDSFADAAMLGALGSLTNAQSWVLTSSIDPVYYPLEWPGGVDEPGHRDLPAHQAVEAHIGAGDTSGGVSTVYYGFPLNYGNDPEGNPLTNMINDDQKDLVRNIMELYGYYAGIQFVESEAGGLPIAVGDLRWLDPTIPTGPGGVAGLGGPGGVVLDYADFQTGPYTWGGGFYTVMMHEIGHALGLGHTYDLPPLTVMGSGSEEGYSEADVEGVFPGNADIIHMQYIHRPDSNDIDVYEFSLEAAGTVSAETLAERLEDVSLLDSVLTLFDGEGNVVARNDDYFSDDSYLEVHLEPGTYYVAVTSTGNTDFDPTISGTGLGGTTQGEYELRVNFVPDPVASTQLYDDTQTLFDGDADGTPGGIFDYWFSVATLDDTIFVDKAAEPLGADGTIDSPFTEIDQAVALAGQGEIVRIVGNNARGEYSDPTTYAAAEQTSAVALGDITGNGIQDMVAVNTANDSVSIWLGAGDGTFTFQRSQSIGAGKAPVAVTLGDFNGDGDLDIVTVNGGDNTISVLLGNGLGQFGFPRPFNVGDGPVAVATADLNGDGSLDLIVANAEGDNLSILIGNGDGTFKPQTQVAVGNVPVSVAVGDLNGNGNVDVVVASEGSNSVGVLLGNGDGTFVPPVSYTVGSDPVSVGLADLNGDGSLDIVTANRNSQNVSILEAIGDGRFYDAVSYNLGGAPDAMVLADMDNDTAVDIVVTRESDVLILYGNGNGTFARRSVVDMGEAPFGLAVGNLSEDGTRDIVTANPTANNVSVVLAKVDQAYEIGKDRFGQALPDGYRLNVPKGVTVMIDAGAVLKLFESNIDVGTNAVGIDRSKGALQVLGTPQQSVVFTSYYDESFGVDHDEIATVGMPGDWGGLVFRSAYDHDYGNTTWEDEGIFLNYVAGADMRYGGGQVKVDSVAAVYNPIHMVESRPTVMYNTIRFSEDAAMSADPNSFGETHFLGEAYTADYGRVGPDIRGNHVVENSINGLFVRATTPAGDTLKELEISARWDDADIVHVVGENLVISGNPGGPLEQADGTVVARLDARLAVDPGVTVKLNGSRIEAESSSQIIAEGLPGYPIIFTSLLDQRYGAGGTFNTPSNTTGDPAEAMDWGGIYFGTAASGSIDRAVIAYGGGTTLVEGGEGVFFNPIEIHQADVRVANSILEYNGAGSAGDRYGRGDIREGTEATIFVRGAQPVIVNNIIRNSAGNAISIDANAMNFLSNPDSGRVTGEVETFEAYLDNYGPLVRENRMTNNDINGMLVRGGTLTTESIWDDTDIVHVLREEIVVPNHHTYSGLRLQSSVDESLVVKLSGEEAGFTAMGVSQEIEDRIGGTVQIIGTPEHPVVLTALQDDSFGAGFDPWGNPQMNTDNANDVPTAGEWRSIRFDEYSNDRNVAVHQERESVFDPEVGTTNDDPANAENLGFLAESEKDGDDVLRLGFEVNGAIRADDPDDMDVYSFEGTAGTEVWIDIDRTSQALDTVVELVDADGQIVFAMSDDSYYEQLGAGNVYANTGLADPMFADSMDRDVWLSKDTYSMNMMDAGMRVVLPGTVGLNRTYYVRVRSAAGVSGEGLTSGAYHLQIRLRETQEYAGSTVQYASIHYATNGIEMFGLPSSSPLLAETSEYQEYVDGQWRRVEEDENDTRDGAVDLGNLLETSASEIKVIGDISTTTDVDWYQFEISLPGVQRIEDVNADTPAVWPVVFDIDYADGTGRPDTQIWVFDSEGRLIYRGDDSSVGDDVISGMRTDSDNLAAGSYGAKDAYIGPIHLSQSGTYYVAVTGTGMKADALNQDLIRREPVNSVNRAVEDHFEGNLGDLEGAQLSEALASLIGPPIDPDEPATELVSGTNALALSFSVDPYQLGDTILYVTNGSDMYTVNPFTGATVTDVTGPNVDFRTMGGILNGGYTDIEMRDDGRIFGIEAFDPGNPDATSSRYRQISTADGQVIYDYQNTAGAEGIETWRLTQEGDGEDMKLVPELADVGVYFTAFTYVPPGTLPIDGDSEDTLDEGAFLAVGQLAVGEYQRNLLYIFNTDGEPINPPNSQVDGDGRDEDYVGTDPLPLGMLTSSPSIGMVGAENVLSDYDDDLVDGFTFEIDAEDDMANTETYVFEFDFGYEVRYLDDTVGVNDGDTFEVDGTTFEFDDGRGHIITVDNFNFLQDGDTFTITNENGVPVTFEISFDGILNDDTRTGVYLQAASSNEEAAQIIAATISMATVGGGSSLGIDAVAEGADVVLSGDMDGDGDDGTIVHLGATFGLSHTDTEGVASGNVAIPFAYSDSVLDILQAVTDAINDEFADSAFTSGNRITFADSVGSINFSGTDALTQTADAAPGVGTDNIAIPVHAGMSTVEITEATVAAINDADILITATANGGTVGISGISDSNWIRVTEPLSAFGGGQGGVITGLTLIDNVLYAVDNAGGFYMIENLGEPGFTIMEEDATPNNEEDEEVFYIMRPTDDNEDGIPDAGPTLTPLWVHPDAPAFSGLDHGPDNAGLDPESGEQKGPYADMLFATTRDGYLYAFGIEEPEDGSTDEGAYTTKGVFLDGQSKIDIGIRGATGVAFSNIDYNLWHPTERYDETAGHGITEAHDLSRVGDTPGPATQDEDGAFPADGNISFYFGLEEPDTDDSVVNQAGADRYLDFDDGANSKIYSYAGNYTNGEVLNTYDVPGGAHGSITTNTFSLASYSPGDEPMLYFNYFLDTEGGEIWDGAKVYVSADGATWELLASNTDLYGFSDLQYKYGDKLERVDEEDARRVELNDDVGGGWRQACVQLSDYAGLENLRLRFDFSTAGDMNVGDPNTTGSYLTALPGNELLDGQSLSITFDDGMDEQVFEFDMGFSLLLPNVAGAAIPFGETITMTGKDSTEVTFEFVEQAGQETPGNVPILIHSGMSTAQVGDAIETAVLAAFPAVDPWADPPEMGEVTAYVKDSRVYLRDALDVVLDSASAIVLEGDAPGVLYDAGAVAVPIHAGMTAAEVANALAVQIDARFSTEDDCEDLPEFFTSVKVDDEFLHVIGHGVNMPDPENPTLPFSSSLMGDGENLADDQPQARFFNNGRGQDNRFEGFYIDDIIIGCTERGEMITDALPEDTFSEQTTGQNITTGRYELSIRTGTEYGVYDEASGSLFLFNPMDPATPSSLFKAYNTNDRMSDSFTLLVPEAKEITEGHRFTISDGVDVVTFQFLDEALGNAPTGDAVPIVFSGEETLGDMARLVALAINSVEKLDVVASHNGVPTSNRVNLFGATKTAGIDAILFGESTNASAVDTLPGGVIRTTASTDANALRDAILGQGIAPIGDATLVSGDASAGFWTDGYQSGILLTTGDVAYAAGPNDNGAGAGEASGQGDADLDAEFGEITTDATSLEFDFDWQGGDFFVQFFFGSEEFNELFTETTMALLEANFLTLDDLASDIFSVFVDGVNVAVLPYTSIPVGAKTVNGLIDSEYYVDNDPDVEPADLGPYINMIGYDGFSRPFNAVAEGLSAGEHHIKIAISDTAWDPPGLLPALEGLEFDTGIFITAGSVGAEEPRVYGTETVYRHEGNWGGDENRERAQGQTIIESNTISNSLENGIVFDSGAADDFAHPGPTGWLNVVNQDMLVPAATIRNNLISGSGSAGVLFSGFGEAGSAMTGGNAVPFGRIVNNTIYGGTEQSGTYGIKVEENAGPTILNNIVSSVGTGIDIDASSVGTTRYDNTVYHNVRTAIAGGSVKALDDVLDAGDSLFVDPEHGNFYLDRGAVAIDSATNVVQDRLEMSSVRDPLGISRSPILAPDVDLYGQLRSDDPNVAPPPGLGQNVFKDRGAIDRTDFAGPTAGLVNPLDNGTKDRNSAPYDVYIVSAQLVKFSIQLEDGGVGVNDYSVVTEAVQLYRDDQLLEDGVDYFFQYNTNTNVIDLIPVAGIWADGHEYTIYLDNTETGIRDLANNPITENRGNGDTRFSVAIAGTDYGDAPIEEGYPTVFAQNGARHVIIPEYQLGLGVSSEPNARFNASATADTYDDGIAFDTSTLEQGKDVQVSVTFSVPDDPAYQGAWFSGWIDFNADGDWNDAGEQVFADEMLYYSASADPDATDDAFINTVVFTISIPADAVLGQTFARFRMSTDGGLGVTGEASSGEVEDYAVVIGQLTDFGDAPSALGYATTLAEDGARHLLGSGLYLGDTVDDESDAIPDAMAMGDDLSGVDDEDGVAFDGYVVVGETNVFTVTASGEGYLNAWIDYNGDGDWDDLDEQIFSDVLLSAGTHDLSVIVPAGASPKETFARFRFSSEAGLGTTGLAADGEVEDYRVLLMSAVRDFGDAPVTYPTLLNNSAASHALSDLHLGQTIDYELDGQPNQTASGDDKINLDDEDGVYLPEVLTIGDRVITIEVSGGGYLNAWIDLNQDGHWTGAEQLITGLWVEPDDDNLVDITITIPETAELGDTFARFRFSSLATLSYSGPAPDGEVEDYAVTIGLADFGDAPQGDSYQFPATGAWANYPTEGKDAAAHVESNLRLGTRIDYEDDGTPSANADGDDLMAYDDEDGVVIEQGRLPVGEQRLITVTASDEGYLNAWIDFNQDGDWDDEGEHFIDARLLEEGQNEILVDIPDDIVPGKTFARFRFSTKSDLSYDGLAPDGEIEDYSVVIGQREYGDAPASYEQGDPGRHLLSEVYLGTKIDVELAPQSSIDALGDDLGQIDDEDGVFIQDGRLAIGRNRPITVQASASGYLNIWLDINQNGNWSDPGEHILAAYELGAGTNQVFVDIPNSALIGETYARFRFSSVPTLAPTGQAADGEVEDYLVELYNSSSVVEFPEIDYKVVEGDEGLTAVEFLVRRVGLFNEEVVFDYETVDGTATEADNDYLPASGSLIFGRESIANPVIKPWDVFSLTNGLSNEVVHHISGNYLVWESKVDGDWEIYLWNNTSDETAYWQDEDGQPILHSPKIHKLTDNDYDDRFASVYADGSVVNVAWSSRNGETDDYEVQLWHDDLGDGEDGEVYTLTNNVTNDTQTQVSGTHVAWLGNDNFDQEIYLLDIADRIAIGDGYQAKNVSNNTFNDAAPQLSGSRVVWVGQEPGDREIYLYDVDRFELDGTQAQRISQNSVDDERPQIDGRNIVWQSDGDIYLYEIAVNPIDQTPATDILAQFAGTTPTNNQNPKISGENVIWQGYSDAGFEPTWEIYRVQIDRLSDPSYTSAPVENLSNNGGDYDDQASIAGSQVVWRTDSGGGDREVYYYDLDEDSQATNISSEAGTNATPLVSSTMTVWRHLGEGETNYDIVVAERGASYMEQSVTVYVKGDRLLEEDEYFTLRVWGDGFDTHDGVSEKPTIWVLNDDPEAGVGHSTGLDFGDAGFDPVDPLEFEYPTRMEDDGARHVVDQTLYLGSVVDTEDPDEVTPHEEALGDDYLYGDDEDGVEFGDTMRQGDTLTIVVTASAPGKLDAWFDFNHDGSWEGYESQDEVVWSVENNEWIWENEFISEKVFDSIDLVAGENILTLSVPEDAYIGDSLARFRLSSEGGLSYTGCAMDGEVEDHLFTVEAAAAKVAGDFNGDGTVNSDDLDLVRANWGLHVTKGDSLLGDGTGDGIVNSDDLDLIRANWGTTLPAAASVSPAVATSSPAVAPNLAAPEEDAPAVSVFGPKTESQMADLRRALTAAQDAVFTVGEGDSESADGLAELAWAYEVERLRMKSRGDGSEGSKAGAADLFFGDYDAE